MNRALLFLVGGCVFALLATANAGGYRYGGSDQAFYVPAVIRALDPAAFPRDRSLIDAQAALTVVDDVLAIAVRTTGASIATLFFVGYLLAVALTWAGLVALGTRLSTSPLVTLALGAAFTMRHQISRTSANSFEPYFHPRMLAFALGLLATGAVLRRRGWLSVALVIISAIVHTTTALWFAVMLGVALTILDPMFRRLAIAGGFAGTVLLAWAVSAGPLRAALTRMDAVWLQAVASKDSLFATDWPLWAWIANLGLVVVLWGAHRWRQRTGRATPEDAAVVWGATALVVLFLLTLPFVAARLALVVEFQVSRVFWLVDVLATAYLIAALVERSGSARTRPWLAGLLILVSVSRALYVTTIEHPERPLLAIRTPDSPWEDVMRWMSTQPMTTHVLADPGHGWKYGTSVRVTGARDVFLEEVKDSAIAIYSHDVAARVVERTAAIGDFSALTADRARTLAAQYGLDLLVTEADLPLPVVYKNQRFRVYRLRGSADAP